MIYIISGASRAGKSLVAKKVSEQKGISYFSLDWLVMGFTNGLPEYGIHDLLFPDEIARRSWSFLKAMFESMLWNEVDYIIEGEAILPELVVELCRKHPEKLRVCFLGFTDVDITEKVADIKKFSLEENDWLMDKSDEYITDHVNNMIVHSKIIEKTCKENNLKYCDTSNHFLNSIDEALEYLSR